MGADPIFETREAWLTECARYMDAQLQSLSLPPLPQNVRLACGWPDGPGSEKVLASCYAAEVSTDATFEIFISPVLDKPLEVAAALAHELCHAVAGIPAGHGPDFERLIRPLGLVGPAPSTTPGPIFLAWWLGIEDLLGPYPHARMQLPSRGPQIPGAPPAPRPRPIGAPKPQKGRLLKASCPACGYIIRASKACMDRGLPVCVCGSRFVQS